MSWMKMPTGKKMLSIIKPVVLAVLMAVATATIFCAGLIWLAYVPMS